MLGELTVQTLKMQTYQDALEALLNQSAILPPELLRRVDEFIEGNKQLGYITRMEFIREAVNESLSRLSGKYEYVKIPKDATS